MQIATASSLSELARQLGASPHQLAANRIDLAQAHSAHAHLVQHYERRDAQVGVHRTAEQRADDLTVFLESPLSTTLAPVNLQTNRKYLFAPGYAASPLIPVAMRAPAMGDFIRWEAYTESGEATAFAPGDVSGLRFVGQSNDMAQQPLGWDGVGVKVNPFDTMRDALKGAGSKLTLDMATAGRVMADYAEQVGGWGISGSKIPGFFVTGSSMTATLAFDPGNPATTAEQLNQALGAIDELWYRANPAMNPSGVIMPRRWWANWRAKFFGVNGEGAQAWQTLRESYSWLSNPVLDDRLLTPVTGKAFMQLFAGDAESQYFEAQAPMVMGPYPMGIEDVYYFVAQTGGVINKDRRNLLRAVAS